MGKNSEENKEDKAFIVEWHLQKSYARYSVLQQWKEDKVAGM